MTRVIRSTLAPFLLLLLVATGCKDLESPNFNFADLDDLRSNPTRANVTAAIQGLLIGSRIYVGQGPNDIVSELGILGRQSYNLDNQDPRFESQLLRQGGMDPAAPAFGGNYWLEPYANIRLGDLVLNALDQLPDDPLAGFTAAEKAWVRGFVKTINAVDFLTIVITRDTNCGCPIEVLEDVADPAPTVDRQGVYDKIVSLLDGARSDLAAASGPPPFQLSSGFDGLPGSGAGLFKTPAGFLQFNRALAARVQVYIGSLPFGSAANFTAALQALTESFLDAGGDLDIGVYHAFGTGSGDITNGLFEPGSSPNLRAHPSIKADAEAGDLRFARKTRAVDSRSFQGLCSPQSIFPVCDVGFDIYNSLTTPIPIIRNEELILLRAEANIGLGNLAAAAADINLIRAVSGGLPPVALVSQAQALDQLLFEKRYSLLYEGGHRWIDARRYGKLGELPLDLPGHIVFDKYPIPIDEQLARQ
ncbi:MAG: RagB/SusD family nutrient uptake outer membrane protein [Gemmatimonadota bacterium]